MLSPTNHPLFTKRPCVDIDTSNLQPRHVTWSTDQDPNRDDHRDRIKTPTRRDFDVIVYAIASRHDGRA